MMDRSPPLTLKTACQKGYLELVHEYDADHSTANLQEPPESYMTGALAGLT